MPQSRFAPLLAAACVAASAACDSSVTDDTPQVLVATLPAIALQVGTETGVDAAVPGASTQPRVEWRTLDPSIATVHDPRVRGDVASPTAAIVRGVAVGTTVIVVGVPGRPESVDSVRVTVGPA